MDKLKGQITICKVYCDEPYVQIMLEDENSSTRQFTVEISIPNFAEALMGGSNRECTYKATHAAFAGKKHEHKYELLTIKSSYKEDEWKKNMKDAITPHEIDGWVARIEGYNHHRVVYHNPDGTVNYRVIFDRYI